MKTIHIHIGPHKTGSSSIQSFLKSNANALKSEHKIYVPSSNLYYPAARALSKGEAKLAEVELGKFAQLIEADSCREVIISAEDFAGDLPGRTRKRRPYPALWENIKVLERAFEGCRCIYYFFERDTEAWMRSAYIQNLKYRNRFSSFVDYHNFVKHEELWENVLRVPKLRLGDRLFVIPYESETQHSVAEELMHAITAKYLDLPGIKSREKNVSPSTEVVRLLECINKSGSSVHAKRMAKQQVLENSTLAEQLPNQNTQFSPWPPALALPNDFPTELENLWERCKSRVHTENQPDLLPAIDTELASYRCLFVESAGDFPEGGRGNMQTQLKILRHRMQHKPEICVLLGLTISYLRRDTQTTNKARQLFQRLWIEEYKILLAILPTRWLISSLQTFFEHGATESQRNIGASGFFFANLMKAYEAERALEGSAADATYQSSEPNTKMGFSGLDRFRLGGSDLMLNTLAHLLECTAQERIAGRVLEEFLLRLKVNHSVFSRMDKSRQVHEAHINGFLNCWSFFEEP